MYANEPNLRIWPQGFGREVVKLYLPTPDLPESNMVERFGGRVESTYNRYFQGSCIV